MRTFALSSGKTGFRLLVRDTPNWSAAVQSVFDATLGRICCARFMPTRLLHRLFIELPPEGPLVEEIELTVKEGWLVAKALDLNIESSWAITASIIAEELVEEGLTSDAESIYCLLDEHGFDREGYAKETA